MKKSMLSTALLMGLSMHNVPPHALSDLGVSASPQPNPKRGKFKRRTKGSKK